MLDFNDLESVSRKYDLVYQDDLLIVMHNFHKGYLFYHDENLQYDYEKFVAVNNKRNYLFNKSYKVIKCNVKDLNLEKKTSNKVQPHIIIALILVSTIVSLYTLNNNLFNISELRIYITLAFNPQLYNNDFTSPLTLLSYAFIHFSYTHLLFNMFFIYIFGSKVEYLLGKIKTLLIVFLTIIGSSILISLTNENVFIGGMSGVGYALITFAILGQYIHPYRFLNQESLKSMIILLVFNVVYSFVAPNVSLLGHLLGIAFGILFFIGYFVGERYDN